MTILFIHLFILSIYFLLLQEVEAGVWYEVFVGDDYGTYKIEIYEWYGYYDYFFGYIYDHALVYSDYYYSNYYYPDVATINSHSHVTIGYTEYIGTFDGYMDDVS